MVMISCRQAATLNLLAQDCKLPLRQRLALKLHIGICTMCRRHGHQLRFLRARLRELGTREALDEVVGDSLGEAGRERIRARVADPG